MLQASMHALIGRLERRLDEAALAAFMLGALCLCCVVCVCVFVLSQHECVLSKCAYMFMLCKDT
jgi:formate/nitrite transporter FocA (FNT family)